MNIQFLITYLLVFIMKQIITYHNYFKRLLIATTSLVVGLCITTPATAQPFVAQTGAANPFNGVDVGANSMPTFGDIDNDGDMDVFIGESAGTILYYKNTGTSTNPIFTPQTGTANPLNGVDVGNNAAPSMISYQTLCIGESTGTIKYYLNTGTPANPIFTAQTGTANPFNGMDVGSNSTIGINQYGEALIGQSTGTIYYVPLGFNYGPFGNNTTMCSLDGVTIQSTFITPASWSSGDYVSTNGYSEYLIVGNGLGTIRSYQLAVTMDFQVCPGPFASSCHDEYTYYYTEQIGTNNPFNGIDVGDNSAPASADIDGDGDNDVIIGALDGTLKYYRNDFIPAPTCIAPSITTAASSNSPICSPASLNLSVAAAGTSLNYSWTGVGTFTNGTTATPSVAGASTGTYSVTVTNSCGTVTSSVGATVNNYPVFALGTSSTRCQLAESVSYAAANATSYSLTGGGTSTINTSTGMVTWSATFVGAATILATGPCGIASHSVTVNAAASPPTISSLNTSVCAGTSVTLTGSTALEYAWFRNGTFVFYSNTSSDYTFPALAGANVYTLVAIYAPNVCFSTQSASITVNGNQPVAVITPSSPTTFCAGNAPTLDATPPTGTGYSYSWIGTSPSAATTTTATFIPTKSGNHKVIVTDANGCSKSSTWMPIVVKPLPGVYAGANRATCVNNSIMIGINTAAGQATYSWSPSTDLSSATISRPTLTPSAAGVITYTLTAQSVATGCVNTSSVTITTTVLPSPTLVSTASPVCFGTSITLTPVGATGAVNWYSNGVLKAALTNSAPRILTAITTGSETYTIRAKSGTCVSDPSNPVSVEIKPVPIPTISATTPIVSNIVTICNPGQTSGSTQLTANTPVGAPSVSSYNWQQYVGGVATDVIPVVATSNYTASVATQPTSQNNKIFRVQVNYSNGCSKNSGNVTVKLLPVSCTGRIKSTDTEVKEVFSAYPNPTESVLQILIENSPSSEGKLVLYNTLGQEILSRSISLEEGVSDESLDLSEIVAGVYSLSFQTVNGNKVQKIVKE